MVTSLKTPVAVAEPSLAPSGSPSMDFATQMIFTKNKRLSEVQSGCHLPADLCPEILSRLPAKSLLRFRCVSKSWLSLINDPDFCRLHLNNFKNNSDETHLLVVEGRQQNFVVRCSDTFETGSETCFTLGRSWSIQCSIDGLILLKTLDIDHTNYFLLWNPSIRKLHKFPPLPKIYVGLPVEIGLGYDPLIKDYKHVNLMFSNGALVSVAIYTLGSRSWKLVRFQGKGCHNWRWLPPRDIQGIYLRGSLYFIVKDPVRDVSELVAIDMSSEVFYFTSLPDQCHLSSLTLLDGGCSLSVFDIENGSVWMLESESICWTKRYSFDFPVPDFSYLKNMEAFVQSGPEFLYLKKNGDMLIQWCRVKTSLSQKTGRQLLQRRTLVSSYNAETNEEKILLQTTRGIFKIYDVRGHIESLVLLK